MSKLIAMDEAAARVADGSTVAVGGLLKAAGIEVDKVRWVPSNGGAPALQEVMAGGITMFSGSPIEAKGMRDGGRVRTIALMTEAEAPAFPGVPTAKAQGVDWVYENWFALVAPKGIPEDRRAKLYELAKKANIKSVYDQNYPPATTDFSSLIRGIRAARPEMVFVMSYPNDSVAIIRAVNEIGG